MLDKEVVVLLLAVVATVVVLILFYCILLCLSTTRASRSAAALVAARSVRSGNHVRRPTTTLRSVQSTRFCPAEDNSYIVSPTATAAESQRLPGRRNQRANLGGGRLTLPSNMFLSSDTSLMRFYTAAELQNFPFDEHIEELRRQMEEEERHRPQARQIFRHGSADTSVMFNRMSGEINRDREMVLRTPDLHSPSIVFHHPDIVINPPAEEIAEFGQVCRQVPQRERQQNRGRLCFSIPASYVGRPPAYLPGEEAPPSYREAVNSLITNTNLTQNDNDDDKLTSTAASLSLSTLATRQQARKGSQEEML